MTIGTENHTCGDCGGAFKSEGYLKLHREKKHGDGDIVKPFVCTDCNKILQSKRNLDEHIKKIHRTCKFCKEIFETENELVKHKRMHTTCAVCHVDMITKYKLERHVKTHI